jgi:hypothetical protein
MLVDTNKLNNYFGSLIEQAKSSLPGLVDTATQTALSSKIEAANDALMTRHREAVNFFYELEKDSGGAKHRDPITSDVSKQLSFIVDKIIGVGGYARPTRFYLEFAGVDKNFNERLSRNCISVNMPGKGLATQPLKIYGPPKEYPYETLFNNEVTMSFRVGQDYFERNFFEMWLDQAMSPRSHDVKYSDSYKTSIKIYALDTFDSKIYCSELQDCFCKSVGDISFSQDQTDAITTVDATISFSEYFVLGTIDRDREQRLAALAAGNSIVTLINTLYSRGQKSQEAAEAIDAAGVGRNVTIYR